MSSEVSMFRLDENPGPIVTEIEEARKDMSDICVTVTMYFIEKCQKYSITLSKLAESATTSTSSKAIKTTVVY
jgi:hypothetical protein